MDMNQALEFLAKQSHQTPQGEKWRESIQDCNDKRKKFLESLERVQDREIKDALSNYDQYVESLLLSLVNPLYEDFFVQHQ